MYSDRRGYGQKPPRIKALRTKAPDKSPREQLRENLYRGLLSGFFLLGLLKIGEGSEMFLQTGRKCFRRWRSSSLTTYNSSLWIWTLVISCFMSGLHNLRPNCRHRRRTVDELAATLHFSHHARRSSSDFNLQLVKDMKWCIRFWRCSCCGTD